MIYTKNKTIFFCLLLLFFLFFPQKEGKTYEKTKHILFLYATKTSNPWNTPLEESFRKTLEKKMKSPIDINAEGLDLVHFKKNSYLKMIQKIIKYKYASKHFDLILLHQEESIIFFNKYLKDYFTDSHIIYFTIHRGWSKNEGGEKVIRYFDRFDIKSNIETAVKFFPKLENIYVITGNSYLEKKIRKQVINVTKNIKQLHVHDLHTLPMDDIITRISDLPKNSLIYFGLFHVDINGKAYNPEEVVQNIRKYANAPIMANVGVFFPYEILGGYMEMPNYIGSDLAKIAYKILKGKKVKKEYDSISVPIFNWRELKKWKIKEELLPKGAVLKYKKHSFYELHKKTIITIVLVLIIETSLVCLLFFLYRKQKKTKTNLSKKTEQLERLISSTPDLIAIINTKKHLIEANSTFLDIFDIKDIPYKGKSIKEISDQSEFITNDVVNFFHQDENLMNSENQLYKIGKNFKIYDMLKVPLNSESGLSGEQIIIGRDITDRIEMEKEKDKIQQQLFQAQKMKALGVLASGIAHDFNNILTGIIGSISLLKHLLKKENSSLSDDIYECISIAMNSSLSGAELIKKFMGLARKEDMNFTEFDINISLQNVKNICTNSFRPEVNLIFDIFNEPLIIFGDKTHIEQVILNLAVNAFHAMTIMKKKGEKKGGLLKITNGIFHADSFFWKRHPDIIKNESYAFISVSDTGVGIEKKTLEQIFDPFFTTKEKKGGTGLGMSTVYSILKKHNGVIDIYSEVGEGTEVIIYFPLLIKENININYDDKVDLEFEKIDFDATILVIDDDILITDAVKIILKVCGYNVIIANNGQDGIEAYKENSSKINLVLLDITMPKMNGFEVFKQLKKINKDIKVIMTSGFAQDKKIEKAIKEGALDFIKKPYSTLSLSKLLKKSLTE